MLPRRLHRPLGRRARASRSRVAAAAIFTIGTLASSETSAVCPEVSRVPTDIEVAVTPETPCVEVEGLPSNCSTALSIQVFNGCEERLLSLGGLRCESRGVGDGSCWIEPGEFGAASREDPAGEVDVVYQLERAGEPVEIHVRFWMTVESSDSTSPFGCAVSPTAPAKPPAVPLSGGALLTTAAFAARRRRRPR